MAQKPAASPPPADRPPPAQSPPPAGPAPSADGPQRALHAPATQRYGPLAVERHVKDDGRALLIYTRRQDSPA